MTNCKDRAEQYVREHLRLYYCGSGCGCMYPNDNGGDHPGGQCVWHEDAIQLQHWFHVLHDHIAPQSKLEAWTDNRIRLWTGEFALLFNLTTGQPATETDYEELCDILGV